MLLFLMREKRSREEKQIAALLKPKHKDGSSTPWACLSRKESTQIYRAKKYGLTPERILEMLKAQGGECANPSCGRKLHFGYRGFHVDHDHSCCDGPVGCGKCVRGLLCPGCNQALGMLGDSIPRALGLAKYICQWKVAQQKDATNLLDKLT
jgi:hypothetical protein